MSTWHWERIDKPWKEPQGFGRATNRDIYGFIGFKDMLYAGTYNAVQDDQHTESNSGAEIWRSPDGNDWEQVFKAAAKEYGYIRSFAIMEGRLYASMGKLAPYALYATSDGIHWTDGAGPPAGLSDRRLPHRRSRRYPGSHPDPMVYGPPRAGVALPSGPLGNH